MNIRNKTIKTTTMKKPFLFLLVGIATMFTSCEKINPNNLNTPEGVTNVKNLVSEKFGTDLSVVNLMLSASEDLSSDIGLVNVYYTKDGKTYKRTYMDYPSVDPVLEDEEESKFHKDAKGSVKLADLDFGMLTKYFGEATKMIGDKYEGFQMSSWTFDISDDNKTSANFKIQATEVGEGTSMEGRNIVTNFYEFEFEVDEEGNLVADA